VRAVAAARDGAPSAFNARDRSSDPLRAQFHNHGDVFSDRVDGTSRRPAFNAAVSPKKVPARGV